MRFESKHNYFKDLAHRVKCYIPKTMAERHQELLCYYLNSASKGSSFVKETMVGPGMYIHSVYMYTVPGDFMYMYICTCTFIAYTAYMYTCTFMLTSFRPCRVL